MDTAPRALPRPERREADGEIQPGGRRSLTLTLDQVAAALQVDVRIVRKLMRIQREEDTEAAVAGRAARVIGIRGLYVTPRVTRITEQALGEFLRGSQPKSDII